MDTEEKETNNNNNNNDSCVILCDYITKSPPGDKMKNALVRWCMRWFVLYDNRNMLEEGDENGSHVIMLYYYENKETFDKGLSPKGKIDLKFAKVHKHNDGLHKYAYVIDVITIKRVYHLCFTNDGLCSKWLHTLQKVHNDLVGKNTNSNQWTDTHLEHENEAHDKEINKNDNDNASLDSGFGPSIASSNNSSFNSNLSIEYIGGHRKLTRRRATEFNIYNTNILESNEFVDNVSHTYSPVLPKKHYNAINGGGDSFNAINGGGDSFKAINGGGDSFNAINGGGDGFEDSEKIKSQFDFSDRPPELPIKPRASTAHNIYLTDNFDPSDSDLNNNNNDNNNNNNIFTRSSKLSSKARSATVPRALNLTGTNLTGMNLLSESPQAKIFRSDMLARFKDQASKRPISYHGDVFDYGFTGPRL